MSGGRLFSFSQPVPDQMAGPCGIVVIGRNEGYRLRTCLESVLGEDIPVVYVDSGSTDDSLAFANSKGVEVVSLDMSFPFTAARARNEGFQHLLKLVPELKFVQFVDGDCEVIAGWLLEARKFLDANEEVAAVCGRLRERFPSRSVYNLLCDIEWDTPVGEIKACGGNAMIRVEAFSAVAGFRSELIAGEEPDLCVRLRTKGWKVWCLEREMAFHDAAMLYFSQWWTREVRSGYAFANGELLHRALPERHWLAETRRNWFWGLGFPLFAIAIICSSGAWGLLVLAVYPAQILRLSHIDRRHGKARWWRALFLVIGKFPEMLGQSLFYYRHYFGRQSKIIEYKDST